MPVQIHAEEEESKSFMGGKPKVKPMEMENPYSSKSGGGGFTIQRFCSVIGLIVTGLIIALVVIPNSNEQDVTLQSESVEKDETMKKPIQEKKKVKTKYTYEPQHWCLNTDVDEDVVQKCKNRCENPLAPKVQLHKMVDWLGAHGLNKAAAEKPPENLDVVFVGDSIIEGFTGKEFGREDPKFEGAEEVFKSLFSLEDGADYQALTLAISGDRTNNLLWRLQNGELPDSLNPKVFWLQIGTNNFREVLCSNEVVARGVEKIVEEIQEKRPDSIIVINSLLPRAEMSTTGRLSLKPLYKAEVKNVWDGIQMVNEELKSYAEGKDNVHFVDSTSLFVAELEEGETLFEKEDKNKHDDDKEEEYDEGDKKYIPKDLMFDYFHPTVKGYQLWGDSIVEKLGELVPKD